MEINSSTGNQDQSKEVVIDIKPFSEQCICRVPDQLRKINKKAYTPRLISIGPFHYGNLKLATTDNQKPKYLTEFCKRIGTIEKSLEDFVEQKEERIRSSYGESFFELDSDEFVNMIKLDVCFVIELFLRKHLEQDDSILKKPLQEKGIEQDLILFENQLPYFFFEELYNFSVLQKYNGYPSFLDITCNFFSNYNPQSVSLPKKEDIKHFTDLVRLFLLGESYLNASKLDETGVKHEAVQDKCLLDIAFQKTKICRFFEKRELKSTQENSNKCTEIWHSASKLDETGVKLVAVEDKDLLNIAFEKTKNCLFFKKRELKIPCFKVQGDTECIFRSTMVLEQCYYKNKTYICSYIYLMRSLIRNAKDVGLLVEKEIINGSGTNTVMGNMIKKLNREIIITNFCYNGLCEKVNAQYEGCWNSTRAWVYRSVTILKWVYFDNLWRGTGTIAAVILLVLTFIQTYCSILQVR